MLLGKTKRTIEEKEAAIQLDLSNNYKDSAKKAFEEYVAIIEQFKENGKLSSKDYEKLTLKIKDYSEKFKRMK